MLGGKDNYPLDEHVVLELERAAPGQYAAARASREFQQRVLWYLAGTVGVRQFLDLGAGLPVPEGRWGNTHQTVRTSNAVPEADRPTVVYVDNDPVCVAHGRAILGISEQSHYVSGDLTDPGLLDEPGVGTYLDLDRPIGVLLCGVLHHIDDGLDPVGIVRGWVDALPTGSFVVLTHLCDPDPGDILHRYAVSCRMRYLEMLGSGRFRTREQIAGLFDGLRLVEPGLIEPGDWWPCGPAARPRSVAERLVLAGVGSKARASGPGPRRSVP